PPVRRRNALLPTVAIVAFLVVGFLVFSNIWVDKLWFGALGYPDVFATMLWTRVALFVIFGAVLAAIVVGNLVLAHRLSPRASGGSTSELLNRYRDAVGGRFRIVGVVIGIGVGLCGGGAGAAQAMTYQAWRNGQPFGETDPQYGLDIGFYLLDYPWIRFLLSYLITAIVFTTVLVAVLYFLLGAVRMAESGQGDRRRLTSPAAQAHLSVLVGAALVVKAVDYWMDTYGL